MRDLTIGDAARQSGVKVTTIRFYEDRGLLPAPARSEGNQRLYPPALVARLRFIRHARDLGFDLPAIADLLGLADRPDIPCAKADAIARRQRGAVEARIARLQRLKDELDRMIAHCAGGRIAECGVIETLADHRQCLGPHDGHEADRHGAGGRSLSAEQGRPYGNPQQSQVEPNPRDG